MIYGQSECLTSVFNISGPRKEVIANDLPVLGECRPVSGEAGESEVIPGPELVSEIMYVILDSGEGSQSRRVSWYLAPGLAYALPRVFKDAEFVNGQDVMIKARAVKTPEEVLCLKIAYDMTMAGMYEAREFLRPGVRECEVQAVAFKKFYELAGEWTQCANIVCSGPYTAPYRRFTSDRIIHDGDPVIIDIGSRFNGYWGDYTRTWICGDKNPPKEMVDLHMQAYEGMERAEKAIKPGATTEEVALACGEEQILNHSLGHGIGVGANDVPFIGVYPGVTGKDARKLEVGMVFSIEPYVGKPGIGGIRLEDNFVVTEDGCECISNSTPFEPKLMR